MAEHGLIVNMAALMAKKPTQHYQQWSRAELAQLRKLAKAGKSGAQAAKVLGRKPQAIYQKASREGIGFTGKSRKR